MNIEKSLMSSSSVRDLADWKQRRSLQKPPSGSLSSTGHNYHLFQPLLYQVAIAGSGPLPDRLSPAYDLPQAKNVDFQMGEVTSIDFESRYVKADGSVIAYDYLILAVGGQTNFFGMTEVEQNGFQLKNVESAVRHATTCCACSRKPAAKWTPKTPRPADLCCGRRRTYRAWKPPAPWLS
jgi:hypothetical protein